MSCKWFYPAFAFLVGFLASVSSAFAFTQPRITARVDDSVRVRLSHSHPLLKKAVDLGALREDQPLERMLLVLKMSPEQQRAVNLLLDRQQTKGSADFHHWLTPEQFGQQFGPAPADIVKVTGWLEQEGFSVSHVANSGMWIEFSGTAGLVKQAFQTEMRHYQLNGEAHIANTMDLSVPAALAPLVQGVPLHDFFSKPTLVRAHESSVPDFTAGNGAHALTPGDITAIYNLKPLYNANLTGAGQTIAIVAKGDINLSDVAAFQKVFGLPTNVPEIIDNGVSPGVTPDGFSTEASLDAEWAAAVAPGAKIKVVASWDSGTTDGAALSAIYIVEQNLAQIVNVSFTNCEQNLGPDGNAFWSSLWQQAAAQGMSVFVASGDSSSTACAPAGGFFGLPGTDVIAVNGISSTPYNTSVGGTEFDEPEAAGGDSVFWHTTNGSDQSSAIGYIPEMAWNDEFTTGFAIILGTGGGVSTVYPTPSWQTLNVPGLQALTTYSLPAQNGVSPRGIPDISLPASSVHDPFLFCFTDPFHPEAPDCQLTNGKVGSNTFHNAAGGTSFSSPAFAGLMAIINQKTRSQNPTDDGRQGLANYVLYPLAAAEDFSACDSSARVNPTQPAPAGCVFNDVTKGNNNTPHFTGFSAGEGYDLVTGLGSVDADKLANAWSNATASFHASQTELQTTPAVNPIAINHGQSVTFAVGVSKLNGDATNRVPAGNISLIAQGGTLTGSVGVAIAPLAGSSSPATTGNFTVENLPGGSYNLSASYAGDGFFAGSASTALPVTVNPENSKTTLFSDLINGVTQQPYGQQMGFTALVTSTSGIGNPSGEVTLADGGTVFANLKLNNIGNGFMNNCPPPGTVIVTPTPSPLPCFTVGTHVITATYSGDGSFSPSPTPPAPSQTITYVVTKGVPAVAAFAPIVGTGSTTLTTTLTGTLAGISPAAVQPTGTIQFFDGTTLLGQATLDSSKSPPHASIPAMTFAQGIHNISVTYSGDSLFTTGKQFPTQISVGVPFGWSASPVAQTVKPGQNATYKLTVGTVTGFTGNIPLSCISGTDLSPVDVPAGVQCTINVDSVDLTSSGTSASVTVTISTTTQSAHKSLPFRALPISFGIVFAGILWKGRRQSALLLCVIAFVSIIGLNSCGGGSSTPPPPPPPPPPKVVTFTVWGSYPGSTPNITDFNGIALTTTIQP